MVKKFLFLLQKDFRNDWRQMSQWSGILIFLITSIYLFYFFSSRPTINQWNLNFWMIFLFLSIFAGSRSFEDDLLRYKENMHFLVKPQILFLSKLVYHWMGLFFYSILLLFFLNLFIPISQSLNIYWLGLLFLVSLGFSLCTLFISLLVNKIQGKQFLILILGIPITFPLMAWSYQIGLRILQQLDFQQFINLTLPLIGILLLEMAIIIFLLPILWRA